MVKPHNYRYLSIVAIFFAVAMFSSGLVTHKLINAFGVTACGASFIVPIWYLLGDVVTEVYGYPVCRQLIWATMIAYIVYAFLLKVVINLPSPLYWKHEKEYQDVLGVFLRVSLAGTFASLVSGFINSFLLSKWKILLYGKYFWIRSLGSTSIGQFIFVILVNFFIFVGNLPFNKMLQVMFSSFLLKLFFSIIGVIPSSILVVFLKKKENVDTFDTDISFNPFRLKND